MATLETLSDRPTGSQIHDAGLHADEATCPYCGAPLSSKRYAEITAWIEAEKRARIGKVEESLESKFAGEQQRTAAKAPAEVEKAKKDAAAQISSVGKGLRGADIIHRVVHNGTIAGTIICDAKNRSR
jgi:hypothetical protein